MVPMELLIDNVGSFLGHSESMKFFMTNSTMLKLFQQRRDKQLRNMVYCRLGNTLINSSSYDNTTLYMIIFTTRFQDLLDKIWKIKQAHKEVEDVIQNILDMRAFALSIPPSAKCEIVNILPSLSKIPTFPHGWQEHLLLNLRSQVQPSLWMDDLIRAHFPSHNP